MTMQDPMLNPNFVPVASTAADLVSEAISRRGDCAGLQIDLHEMTADQVCALGAAMELIGRVLQLLGGLPASVDDEPPVVRLTPGRRVVIVTPFVMPRAIAFPDDDIVIED